MIKVIQEKRKAIKRFSCELTSFCTWSITTIVSVKLDHNQQLHTLLCTYQVTVMITYGLNSCCKVIWICRCGLRVKEKYGTSHNKVETVNY